MLQVLSDLPGEDVTTPLSSIEGRLKDAINGQFTLCCSSSFPCFWQILHWITDVIKTFVDGIDVIVEEDEELDVADDLNDGDRLEEEFDLIEESWRDAAGSQDSTQSLELTRSSGSSYLPSQPSQPVREEVS